MAGDAFDNAWSPFLPAGTERPTLPWETPAFAQIFGAGDRHDSFMQDLLRLPLPAAPSQLTKVVLAEVTETPTPSRSPELPEPQTKEKIETCSAQEETGDTKGSEAYNLEPHRYRLGNEDQDEIGQVLTKATRPSSFLVEL